MSWFIPDSIWRRKGLSVFILITGFLGVAFQIKVFGLIIFYARHFSSGELIGLAGYTLDPRSSMALLCTGSFIVVMLLFLSSLCIYFSKSISVSMSREYEEFCSKRVFYMLGQSNYLYNLAKNGNYADSYLFRLVKADSRFAGWVLRMLLSLIIPGLTLIAAIVVLLYLEAVLTLLIVCFSILFMYYQYRASKQAANHSIRYETLTPVAGLEYKALLNHLKYQLKYNDSQDVIAQLFTRNQVKKHLDAYEGRLRAVENSRLISGIYMALILGLILLVMGTTIIQDREGWGRLLVYVVALRFAMTSLQNSFSIITSINRFYPQVRRYFLFVQSLKNQNRVKLQLLGEYKLRVDSKAGLDMLEGSLMETEVKPGYRISLVTPLELNRYTMVSMAKAMLGDDERAFKGALYSMRFATKGQSCPGMSLRRVLELGPDAKWPDMRSWFPDQETFELAKEKLPKSLDKEIAPRIWDQVDPGIKFILSLISARQSDCQWILLEAKGLKSLGNEAAKFYLDLFRDRISVMVFNKNLDIVGSFDEDLVAVVDQERILGLGSTDWFASVRSLVENMLNADKGKTTGRKAGGGVPDDDDLDEM
jgi:hypothetical protein